MENVERCYQCNLAPDLKTDKVENKKFVLCCLTPGHGHMAMGDTLEMAKENWNRYISFMRVDAA